MDPITGECTSVKCPIGYSAREGRCEGRRSKKACGCHQNKCARAHCRCRRVRNKYVELSDSSRLKFTISIVPHSCGANEECINTAGSFRCQERGNLCAPGYRMDGESGFCLGEARGDGMRATRSERAIADRDECADGVHTCGGYQCINLPGSYKSVFTAHVDDA